MDFREALTAVYLHSPCNVLPNPLWKTTSQIDQHHSSFQIEGEAITELSLWNEKQLLLYWKPGYQQMEYTHFGSPSLVLVHQDALPHFPSGQYSQKTAYFRYLHSMDDLPNPASHPDFDLVEADPHQQASQVASLINRCYPNMTLDEAAIRSWTQHPTFRSDLWVWAIERKTGLPAALGIAEYDGNISEGALEWIQVLPEYRRQGLGQQLVGALLLRLKGTVQFTTVSGQVDNPTRPGSLYRKCGFTGDDLWWVLRKGP